MPTIEDITDCPQCKTGFCFAGEPCDTCGWAPPPPPEPEPEPEQHYELAVIEPMPLARRPEPRPQGVLPDVRYGNLLGSPWDGWHRPPGRRR